MKIGLTGGIGSGKSMVAHLLEKMGYPVFYSDKVAKELWHTDEDLKSSVKLLVGEMVYQNDVLQTPILAKWIFKSDTNREKINQLIHPKVRAAFEVWANEQKSQLYFNEAAILFETAAYKNFDATVLVCAPLEIRMQRVQHRDQLSKEAIEERMKSQWSDEQKRKFADYILENDENQLLLPQVERMIEFLKEKLKP